MKSAARLFDVGSCATNDPTKAALPFVVAVDAKTAEGDVRIGLVGEAVSPMKDEIARTVHGSASRRCRGCWRRR